MLSLSDTRCMMITKKKNMLPSSDGGLQVRPAADGQSPEEKTGQVQTHGLRFLGPCPARIKTQIINGIFLIFFKIILQKYTTVENFTLLTTIRRGPRRLGCRTEVSRRRPRWLATNCCALRRQVKPPYPTAV
jgi:hypothetical protein